MGISEHVLMFSCKKLQQNTCLLVFSPFSAYIYPSPPMDKGPLAKVNPVCSFLEEFCNQYAGGMMIHIQE